MKLLLDMNVSPRLVTLLENQSFAATHWSAIGAPDAEDKEIFCWAKDNSYVVVTFDLDFGAILAATGLNSPSVIQIRCLDNHPDALCVSLVSALKQFEQELSSGAMIVLDEFKARARLLPLNLPKK